MNEPIIYDLGEFAREFVYALMHWNSAENTAKHILAYMLGNTNAAVAITSDMGSRSLLQGIETAGRDLTDASLRDHLGHFSQGYRINLAYRNSYVHNLKGVEIGGRSGTRVSLFGRIEQTKGEGRLRSVTKDLTQQDIAEFRENCLTLSCYGLGIAKLLMPDTLGKLRTPQAFSEKPVWPAALQNNPHYHQS